MTKLAVVIAAYDEERTVEELTRRLHRVLSALPDCRWEVLYVIEGRDRTLEIVTSLAEELGGIRILYEEEPRGLGDAFRRGFAALPADTDLVVTLDADLNHQPEEIPCLLDALRRRGCDVLVGSRFLAESRVEGAPVWKRLLSGVTNVLMRWVFGVKVRDKTSGFRVYRGEVVRDVGFRNDHFAFLPELLIRARKAGFTIAEEPIHFIFRREGRSKMRLGTTSLSYLSLLRARFDRWNLAAVAFFLTGIAVRLAAAFPVHKYPADADGILAGLCAFKVLRGETPVFFSPPRIGSLECHLAAAVFAVFGSSRVALLAVALLLEVLLLGAAYLFTREILGRRIACLALLFLAVPSPGLIFWTYMPNGYPMMMLLCATILWLGARQGRTGPADRVTVFLLAFAAGLGVWHSFQTLGATAAVGLWLLWKRRDLLSRRVMALAAAGLLLGAFPWIAYNVKKPFGAFEGNYATQPAGGLGAVASNAAYLVTYSLPEALASAAPHYIPLPPNAAQRWLQPVALAAYAAAFLYFLALPLWRRRRPSRREGDGEVPFSAWLLLLLVVGAFAALNLVSSAGSARGVTVRYVLPIVLAAAPILALFLLALGRRILPLAWVLAVCVVALAFAGDTWPWSPGRQWWQGMRRADDRLLALLAERHVDWVAGGYWNVYPLTFLSGERIIGLACDGNDIYHYADWRPPASAHWALVAWTSPGGTPWTQRVTEQAGLAGTLETRIPAYLVFFPAENPPATGPERFRERVLPVCQASPY